jgi:hypothetical protein
MPRIFGPVQKLLASEEKLLASEEGLWPKDLIN